MFIDNGLIQLLQIFPEHIRFSLQCHPKRTEFIEIIIDLGRRPEVRFRAGFDYISDQIVSWQDIEYCVKRVGKFTDSNRAGIERTLHRISCIRNRQGTIIGLTCRFGRSNLGTISILRDLVHMGKSLLIFGPPGIGKTTAIREISRILSDEIQKRVVIIDTSNEIAGDNDVPHAGIGRARRMQVKNSEFQHRIMIEAVENHMPEAIVIDEIGTELEAAAARTIGERGVQLVGTAHGNSLENLIKNPTLTDLIGGVQYVTLSDEEAKRRKTQKSIIERKTAPTFQLAIEIQTRENWIIHINVENSVDSLLRGVSPILQFRKITEEGSILIKNIVIQYNQSHWFYTLPSTKSFVNSSYQKNLPGFYNSINNSNKKAYRVYFHNISKDKLVKIIENKNLPFLLTNNLNETDFLVLPFCLVKYNKSMLELANKKNIRIYVLPQLNIRFLKYFLFNLA